MGGSTDIETKEVPLMSPQQQQMLNQLLQGSMSAMQGFPLGQAYGGPVASSWQPQPFMGPQNRMGGGRQGGSRFGGMTPNMPGKRSMIRREDQGSEVQGNANLMAKLLGGPMADTMTQGMTGNIPKFRGMGA